jgi:hypothetical protein
MQLTHSFESAWFQALSLSSEKLVSNFAFTCNLRRYTQLVDFPVVESPWFPPPAEGGEGGKSLTLPYQQDWSDAARRKCEMEMPHNPGGDASCPLRELWWGPCTS